MPTTLRAFVAAALLCFSLAACGGGGSSSPGPSTPTSSPTLQVNLTQPYTDSGIAVAAGEKVTITATGTLSNGQCATCSFTPSGEPWTACESIPPPAFVAPGLRCWSLIGRIGSSGAPFEIGSSLVLNAPTSGELFVGINDNYFPDNAGGWTVTVSPS